MTASPPPRADQTATEQRPSVLFIAPQPFLEWRGSPLRVNFNVRALAELGYNVDLVVMPFGATPADLPAAVTVYRPRNIFRRRHLAIGPSFWKALYDFPLAFLARRRARQTPYAVVHGVEEAGLMAAAIARRHGIPCIYEKHSDPTSYRKGALRNMIMSLYARMERQAISQASAVIATGPGLADQVRHSFPDKPVHVVSDIASSLREADPQRASRWRSRFAPESCQRLAVYVGSYALYQGMDLLFAAIPPTLARFAQARFLIIGGSPDDIARRRRQMTEADAAHAVTFIERVAPDELPDWLHAADVLLSPRASGVNTPLKILDYMKAGRPIVAADSASNRLLLDASLARTAAAVPESFAKAIADLMRNDNLRADMGRNARARFERDFSYPIFRERLAQCYRQVRATADPVRSPD